MCSTACGIMMQEVSTEMEDPQDQPSTPMPDISIVVSSTHAVLSDFYVKKTSSNMDIQLTNEPTENVTAYEDTLQNNIAQDQQGDDIIAMYYKDCRMAFMAVRSVEAAIRRSLRH